MLGLSNFAAGFVTGFASGFVTREVVSFAGGVFRPLVKTTVRATMAGFQKSRETLAHYGEAFEDLVAEVRSEMAQPVSVSTTSGAASVSGFRSTDEASGGSRDGGSGERAAATGTTDASAKKADVTPSDEKKKKKEQG